MIHAQFIEFHTEKDQHTKRITRHFAAHGHLDLRLVRRIHDFFNLSQDSRMQGLVQIGEAFVGAVNRQRILDQIIGPDTEEINLPRDFIGNHNR
ncbi:MAG: hypothetical protein BWX55_00786 [Deltaproteobacteria bacterium ADurb.Bin022]|nr:MAG: hypothetical protein BWX55_00786 [Deltaproteobacteria bacterium ADurb.Bin022]